MSQEKRVILLLGALWGLCGLTTPSVQALDLEDRQVIGEVTVEGNYFHKRKKVLSKVKIRKGDVVVDPFFRADVDRLLETGFFDEVQVEMQDIESKPDITGLPKARVIFQVKERPLIKRIDFKGNKKLSHRKFRDEIASKPGESFDRFKAAQDIQKILEVYREEGYLDAHASYYTSVNPKSKKIILTFFITEGIRVLVKSVQVRGNEIFSDRKIRRLMKKTRRKKVFKEEELENDLINVEKYYRNKGYFQVFVSTPARTYSDEGEKVSLTLTVEEGRRFHVGELSFSETTVYGEKELEKAVLMKKDRRFKQDDFDDSMRALQDLYADRGYLRAEIIPEQTTFELDEDNGKVDFHFAIREGSIVYVDRIYIDGNVVTKEKVFRREVLLKEGDVFSAGKVRRSVEKLYNLGFMDDVQVDVQQPRSPDQADLVFSVVEGKPGVLSAGAGFSSVDGLLGTMQLQHMNLFGLAQRINFLWEFGARKQNYEIGWTDPWFMDKPMSLGVDVFNTERVRPFGTDRSAFREGRRGGGLRLGPRLTDRLSLIHNYQYEDVRVFDVDQQHVGNADENLNIDSSRNVSSSLTNGFIYDTRDNVFDATRGGRNSLSVQVAGGPFGGNVHYYKPQIASSYFIPTFWKFVFSMSYRGGYIRHYAPSKEVPISERFIMGGVDTVRGYDFGEIGPPDFGRVMNVLNVEYKFPIVQERHRTILQGAFFLDVGGSWRRARDYRFSVGSKDNQMRAGVGFGIRFKTPVFPIRLDWGYGLNHKPGEQISQFYFTIGNLF